MQGDSEEIPSWSISVSDITNPNANKTAKKRKPQEKEDACGSCDGLYLEDTKKKNGAKWIQCQFCIVWYHERCQNIISELHFMCSACEESDDSD